MLTQNVRSALVGRFESFVNLFFFWNEIKAVLFRGFLNKLSYFTLHLRVPLKKFSICFSMVTSSLNSVFKLLNLLFVFKCVHVLCVYVQSIEIYL